jgi:menaquinone-dependent protoporphyrinogen oxidase
MKTLIIFATKYGSVEKCANILKEKLDGDVEVVNIKTDPVPDLGGFDNVIIGGSIYVGKIQQEIKNFCEQHLETLLTKKLGLFICAGEPPETAREELKNAFPAKLYEHAISKELFGNELYYDKLSLIEKLVIRFVKGVKASYSNLSYDNIEKLANSINGATPQS